MDKSNREVECVKKSCSSNLISIVDKLLLPNSGLDRGSSRFLNQEAVLHKKSGDGGDVAAPKPATEEELQAQREAELAALQEELATVDGDFASLEEELRKLIENTPKINAKLKSQTEENQEREEAYKMRKKVLDLLPNADENIKQLQAVIDGSANRLLKLAAKWEERRTELINTYRKLRVWFSDECK